MLPQRQPITRDSKDSSKTRIDAHLDDERRDRLDAEELMHAAMVASTSSLSTTSSVSSMRRSKPPHLPPPYSNMDGATPVRVGNAKRNIRNFGISLFVISIIAGGTFVILELTEVKKTSIQLKMVDTRGVLEVKHQNINVFPSHQLQPTKYTDMGLPDFYKSILQDFHGDNKEQYLPVQWRIPGSDHDAIARGIDNCLGLHQNLDLTIANNNGTVFISGNGLADNDASIGEGATPLFHLENIHVLSSESLHSLTGFLADHHVQGKLFVLLCHPLQRMMTLYYSSQDPKSSLYNPSLRSISIDEFANYPRDRTEFNFVTKSLLADGNGLMTSDQINIENFEKAKEILGTKAMILLSDDKLGSWAKMATWMNWKEDQGARQCVDSTLLEELSTIKQPPLKNDSNIAGLFMLRNQWDVQLFDFAVQLFQLQTATLVR
jgi:hypothetical protein